MSSSVSPESTPIRAGRHARRRGRGVIVAAAGVAVVLVAGVGVVLGRSAGERPVAQVAPLPSVAAESPGPVAPPGPAPASASVPASGSPSAADPDSSAAGPDSDAAGPASGAAAPAPRGGWLPVDQAAWDAQLKKYRATKADPAGDAGNLPEFRADCTYSHRLADDPIVFPALPAASHMHSFVGNRAVDAHTRAADLMKFTATTCKPIVDHSAYWVPTLYEAATRKPVETTGFRVYYRSIRDNSKGIVPTPNGLRMIAGDAKKKEPTPRGAQGQFYCAFYGPGDIDGVARSTNGNWPICGGDAKLHFMMQFPDCWDGKHLDSPTHKAHVAFGTDAGCPSSHPVRIPAITFDIAYGVKGSKAGYYLSSDPQGRSASSMHGDAFVAWDVDEMNQRVRNCIAQRRTCNNDGYDPFRY